MSAATAALSRDPRSRHEGGFDRWNRDSRSGWSLLWRASEYGGFVLGEDRSVWAWDVRERIWSRLPADDAADAFREHERALNRLRRALLVVRRLNSESGVERDAARLALQRIGSAVIAEWQEGQSVSDAQRGVGWLDHPAAVYLAVTRECCCHFPEPERVPFDAHIFAGLVAAAREDFKAGRRSQPPRLRPEDVALLQVPAALSPAPLDAMLGKMSEGREPPEHAGFDYIRQVREDLSRELQREDGAEADQKRRRRQLFLLSGLVVASLAAVTVLVAVS